MRAHQRCLRRCPYQVCAYEDTINVASDFVSLETLDRSLASERIAFLAQRRLADFAFSQRSLPSSDQPQASSESGRLAPRQPSLLWLGARLSPLFVWRSLAHSTLAALGGSHSRFRFKGTAALVCSQYVPPSPRLPPLTNFDWQPLSQPPVLPPAPVVSLSEELVRPPPLRRPDLRLSGCWRRRAAKPRMAWPCASNVEPPTR